MSADTDLFDKFGNSIPAGEIIFREGDEGDKMYIIQKGEVQVLKTINNTEHILAVLIRGDFFGETAIVTRSLRSATVKAATSVELLAFDREGFSSMIEKNAKIALNIIDKLCRRLQNANLQIQHLVKKDEKGLVGLNLLYRFKAAGGEEAQLPYEKTVKDISLNLEILPEGVEGVISGLADEGILSIIGDEIGLSDMGRLSEIS